MLQLDVVRAGDTERELDPRVLERTSDDGSACELHGVYFGLDMAAIHGQPWAHDMEETARLADHCSEQGTAAKRMEWELVANTYHVHLLRGGRLGDDDAPMPTSYNARVTGLRTPWVFLDLADDGAVSGRMHLGQLGGKQRLVVDDFGLNVTQAEPDHTGEHRVLLHLGQRFPCRLRGLDVWSGSLDLAPI